MLPLASLDGDLKSGASIADFILIMGLKYTFMCVEISIFTRYH
jgi:hypothetical protein